MRRIGIGQFIAILGSCFLLVLIDEYYLGDIIENYVSTLIIRGVFFDSFVHRYMLTNHGYYNFLISYLAIGAIPVLILLFSIKIEIRKQVGRCLLALVISGNLIFYPIAGFTCIMLSDKPVEIRYQLSDIPEYWAVMVANTCVRELKDGTECWNCTIVNKEGRYKYISEEALSALRENYLDEEDYFNLYDKVLQMENIPYESGRIEINPYYLQRAINMSDIKRKGIIDEKISYTEYQLIVGMLDGWKFVIYDDVSDRALTPQYMNMIFNEIAKRAKEDLGSGG